MCMSKAMNDTNCVAKYLLMIFYHIIKMIWNIIDDHDDTAPKSRKEILARWPDEISNIFFIQGSSRTHLLRTGVDRCNFAFLVEYTKKDALSEFNFISGSKSRAIL